MENYSETLLVLVLLFLLSGPTGVISECGRPSKKPRVDPIPEGDDPKEVQAVPHSWPWIAQLRFLGSHQCLGTLISKQFLLTAADCFEKFPEVSFWTAHLGMYTILPKSLREETRRLIYFVIHPSYEIYDQPLHYKSPKSNDIALVRLEKPVEYNDYIKSICVPGYSEDLTEDLYKNWIWAQEAGWGYTENSDTVQNDMHQVTMPLIPSKLCHSWYIGGLFSRTTQVCAGYREGIQGACWGHNGAPLMTDHGDQWYIIGVKSLGSRCYTPATYAKVSHFYDWIRSTMKEIVEKDLRMNLKSYSSKEKVIPFIKDLLGQLGTFMH